MQKHCKHITNQHENNIINWLLLMMLDKIIIKFIKEILKTYNSTETWTMNRSGMNKIKTNLKCDLQLKRYKYS